MYAQLEPRCRRQPTPIHGQILGMSCFVNSVIERERGCLAIAADHLAHSRFVSRLVIERDPNLVDVVTRPTHTQDLLRPARCSTTNVRRSTIRFHYGRFHDSPLVRLAIDLDRQPRNLHARIVAASVRT